VLSTAGPDVTIIDGTHSGNVVIFQGGETHDALLSGFTIRGGFAPEDSAHPKGDGILIAGASPAIADNDIVDNVACAGAGLEAFSGSPHIRHNHIHGNRSSCIDFGAGEVVGLGLDAKNGHSQAVRFDATGAVALESEVTSLDDWKLQLANGVNDSGVIIGSGKRTDGQHAFMLVPD